MKIWVEILIWIADTFWYFLGVSSTKLIDSSILAVMVLVGLPVPRYWGYHPTYIYWLPVTSTGSDYWFT